jgi:hypothetical protein
VHRIMIMKIGGKRLHLLKLTGAFIVFWAALMLLSSVYQMFWVAQIVQSANAGNYESIMLNLNGMLVSKPIVAGDGNMQAGLMLPSIAGVMFWAAILLLGGMVYKTGAIVLPIDEQTQDIPDKPKKKKK